MNKYYHTLAALTALFLLSATVYAEEGTFSGKMSFTARTINGELNSAKFFEYEDLHEGVSGSARLSYDKKTYFFDVETKDFAEDDQHTRLRSGVYGKYRVEVIYDKLPHRFAFGAKSLYAGAGTGTLELGDPLRNDLNGITNSTAGDLNGDGKTNGKDTMTLLGRRLNGYFEGAATTDIELFRKTGKVNVDVMAFSPFNLRVEFKREEKDGTRPFSGAFGFSGAFEIPEPIDYDTSEAKIIAEYAKKSFYLNGSYYLSKFENNTNTLTWENPFRIKDSTTTAAYSNPSGGSPPSYAYANNGPSIGLIDLYPDNLYHNVSLSGSIAKLPMKSRLTANASMGWMRQDDAFVPYTTNTAMKTGAVTASSGYTVPFDAFDSATLPQSSPDAKVDTTLYDLMLTSAPMDPVRVKVKYRYYKHDNKTDHIEFPGWARTDAIWEVERDATGNVVNITTEPTTYTNKTAGAEIGLKVPVLRATTVSLGYTLNTMERSETREVESSDDSIITISADTAPADMLTLRASYEMASREGDYEYTAPFHTILLSGSNPPQLPSLRKYDEADRDRNKLTLMASLTPFEPFTLSGSVSSGKDDYGDSSFGLLEDKQDTYNVDATYSLSERLNLSAFYGYEKYENTQKARAWTQGGLNDPYIKDITDDSNGNWEAVNTDKISSVGGKIGLAIVPDRLDFDVAYMYQKSDGTVELSSPLGTAANDSNPATPIEFDDVDDVTKQSVNSKVRYRFSKSLSLAVGHRWEKLDADDFDITGFTYVPTDKDGLYNGSVFMGTILQDYEANVIYSKVMYSF